MSPKDNIFDDFPDDSRDEPEERDEMYGMAVHSLEELLIQQLPPDDPVPTVDSTEDEVEAMVSEYRVSRTGPDTFVISGPCTSEGAIRGYPGRLFTHDEATEWVHATYGKHNVYERLSIPHRWAFRVRKPTAPGGQYTPPKASK